MPSFKSWLYPLTISLLLSLEYISWQYGEIYISIYIYIYIYTTESSLLRSRRDSISAFLDFYRTYNCTLKMTKRGARIGVFCNTPWAFHLPPIVVKYSVIRAVSLKMFSWSSKINWLQCFSFKSVKTPNTNRYLWRRTFEGKIKKSNVNPLSVSDSWHSGRGQTHSERCKIRFLQALIARPDTSPNRLTDQQLVWINQSFDFCFYLISSERSRRHSLIP